MCREDEFIEWWEAEGVKPADPCAEDMTDFIKKICRVAWLNGAYKERHRGGR